MYVHVKRKNKETDEYGERGKEGRWERERGREGEDE